jgi:hypothetical protein
MIAERIAGGPAAAGDTLREKFIARAQTARGHAQKLRQLIDSLPVTAE